MEPSLPAAPPPDVPCSNPPPPVLQSYGPKEAFFVSNMVNVQYVLWGQLVLFYSYWKGHINRARNNCSIHSKIAVMAALVALAGFFAAMGAQKTSGAVQQVGACDPRVFCTCHIANRLTTYLTPPPTHTHTHTHKPNRC